MKTKKEMKKLLLSGTKWEKKVYYKRNEVFIPFIVRYEIKKKSLLQKGNNINFCNKKFITKRIKFLFRLLSGMK